MSRREIIREVNQVVLDNNLTSTVLPDMSNSVVGSQIAWTMFWEESPLHVIDRRGEVVVAAEKLATWDELYGVMANPAMVTIIEDIDQCYVVLADVGSSNGDTTKSDVMMLSAMSEGDFDNLQAGIDVPELIAAFDHVTGLANVVMFLSERQYSHGSMVGPLD